MPIKVNYPGSIPAIGRVAQLGGEGKYRFGLNELATSDENRRVSTQLSLLDMVEGARRTNLNAQVSRENTLNQIQAAQSQQRYDRKSRERMAQFDAQQQMRSIQAQGGIQRQRDRRQFKRQQALGQQAGQRQLGRDETEFGYRQDLQTQQQQANADRQQAQFRQAELSGIMKTLDPQAQGQIRGIQFEKQRAIDDQRKNRKFRDNEFQEQILPQFDQRIDEVIQSANKQPTLEERQEELNNHPTRNIYGKDVPFQQDRFGKWEPVEPISPLKPPEAPKPNFTASQREAMTQSYNDTRLKAYDRLGTIAKSSQGDSKINEFHQPDWNTFVKDYERKVPPPTFDEPAGQGGGPPPPPPPPPGQGGSPQLTSMVQLEEFVNSSNPRVASAAGEIRDIIQQFGPNPNWWSSETRRRYVKLFPIIEKLMRGG